MRIFHIAETTRWEAAKLAGSYAQSTLGRSLEDEGFIHASREDQWETVRDTFYAGCRSTLTLLVIDTDKLAAPWQEDEVGDTTYPHIYGPLNPSAVIEERPLPGAIATPGPSFMSLFVGEMVYRMIVATILMTLSTACGLGAAILLDEDLALVGFAVGLLLGLVVLIPFHRRRKARLAASPNDHPPPTSPHAQA